MSGERKTSRWAGGACGVLVAVHAVLLTCSAVSNSVTYDEFAHLPAGVAYWRWGAWEVYDLSPPLLRLWAAAPVMLFGRPDPPPASRFRSDADRDRHWAYADSFERWNARRYQHLFVLGRLAMAPISCFGAWLVYWWARRLYSAAAGVGACAVYCVEPNVLAHASIVGTDVGTAVAILAALAAWQRFRDRPTTGRAAVAALAVAAAHLCKFTAVLLWPVLIGTLLFDAWRGRIRPGVAAAAAALAVGVTWFAINLQYGYTGSFAPLSEYRFESQTMQRMAALLPSGTPVPFPRPFVRGLDAQKAEAETGYPAFLLGHRYVGSRWDYYPVTLGVKLPIGVLALAAMAVPVRLRRPRPDGESLLIAAAAVYVVGMVGLGRMNVGVRYLLPALVPCAVLLGRAWAPGARPLARRLAAVLVLLTAAESLTSFPRYLTFVNALGGGPARGWTIVNDSNFDWGQGLLDLKRWMLAERVPRLGLAYFGRVDPAVYGIEYTPLLTPSAGDEPLVAVSSYFLLGLPQRMPTPDGPSDFVSLPYAPELRTHKPVAVVGRTIFVYRRADVLAAARARARARDGATPRHAR